MAAQWLAWELAQAGVPEAPIDSADVVLVTCVDARQADYLRLLRKRYPGRVIVAGGAAGTTPYSLGRYADAVCVGDGQPFMQALLTDGLAAAMALPNVWRDGGSEPVEVAQGFPWGCPPIEGEDGAVRVWCGRGCKNRCLFCQTGWAMEYAEHPRPDDLMGQIAALARQGKRVAYLSNDPAQHTFAHRLPPTGHGSYSVAYMRRAGLPAATQVRIGVEGVSERLRRLVAKPISERDLVDCTAWLNAHGKSVRWFMIAGLPGETDDDWLALRESLRAWKLLASKGVLVLSFTAYGPEPATPLGVMPLDDGYWQRWQAFREWFFGGQGWSNRIKLMSPAAPTSRLETAMWHMGLSESALRHGGTWGPNDRVLYPYREARDKAAAHYADATGISVPPRQMVAA